MHLNDFDFHLPDSLIARYPTKKRSDSRLLCVNHQLVHKKFYDMIDLISPHDLLIFNDTKVIPARLFGKKKTGGRVEILIERILDNKRALAQLRVSKAPKIGDEIIISEHISFKILNREQHFFELQYIGNDRSILEVIESIGEIPLPPYMQRAPDLSDQERYQTIYAKHKGSVAAPTAGLHFDDELLARLREKKVQLGYLTLHVASGTFVPVRVPNIMDHKMHAEFVVIEEKLCQQMKQAKERGGRIIAVGTTTLRSLETAYQCYGEVRPYVGETRIFIYPGYSFGTADFLITNFHLPRSTLMMLVTAFGGYPEVMSAYQTAVAESYRFYSYGDAMWLKRKT